MCLVHASQPTILRVPSSPRNLAVRLERRIVRPSIQVARNQHGHDNIYILYPLYLFADDSTLCRTICHPSDKHAAASSLTADLGKIKKLVQHVEHVFQSGQVSYSHFVSLKGSSGKKKKPIYFLNTPLEEVLSLKLLGLTICHNLSWESHIYNLASKASRRLGILHRAKSFLGTPELLTTYKAFIHSLMEYCSPLWVGAPASHLSRLHAVETKAFRIIRYFPQ